MSHLNVTDQNFEQEVTNEPSKPVLVDFWAVWCQPCKIQGPIVEELATDLGDAVKIAKVEVDESPVIAEKFNILSIPTLAIFKEGKMVWQGVGVHQKGALAAELKKHI